MEQNSLYRAHIIFIADLKRACLLLINYDLNSAHITATQNMFISDSDAI